MSGASQMRSRSPTPVASEQDPDAEFPDDVEEVPPLKRSRAVAGKQPRYVDALGLSQLWEEAEEEAEQQPDLKSYFEDFGLSKPQQVRLCRAYANLLAQETRCARK